MGTPTELYAFVERTEVDREAPHVYLECMTAGTVQRAMRSPERFAKEEEFETWMVMVDTSEYLRRSLPGMERPLVEGDWLQLSLQKEGGPSALIFGGNEGVAEPPSRLGVRSASMLQSDTRDALSRMVSLGEMPEATEGDLYTSPRRGGSPTFVAVYKVGQGNCCAVCTEEAMPLAYVDFGAGCYHNAHTHPTRDMQRFCFTNKPPIILTHWHADHYFIAKGSRREAAKGCVWIVPQQPIGPVAWQFALDLNRRRNLRVWPAGLNEMATPFGRILRCTGNDKNSSGLALVARITNSGSRTPESMDVLLPGDCNYDNIGQTGAPPVDALVATHHGSNKNVGTPPQRRGALRDVAYSYGAGNTYKHPRCGGVRIHKNAGWARRLSTVRGHIGLGWVSTPIPPLPCGGKGCDLQIRQV